MIKSETLNNLINKKTARISAAAFVMASMITFIGITQGATPTESTNQDVRIQWIGDSGEGCHKPTDSTVINGKLTWNAQITNFGPGGIFLEKAAFHDNQSGCSGTVQTLDQSIFTMNGKTQYAEGESGSVSFVYDVTAYNCGRVQVDAAFRNANNSGEGHVFLGEIIDYGVDCSNNPPPPPPPPAPTITPAVTVPCVNGNYSLPITWTPAVNNDIRIFVDDASDFVSSWDKIVSGASTSTMVPDGFNPRLPGMSNLILQPGVTYFAMIQNGSEAGPVIHWQAELCPPPPPPPPGTPSIQISKTVRDAASGETNFDESAQIASGEQVEFQIVVTSNGDETANNVVVTDILPDNIQFDSATLGTGVGVGTNSTYSFGDMAVGASRTLKIKATADSNSSFSCGSTSRTNTASATSSNAASVSDSANVEITRTSDCGGGGGGGGGSSSAKLSLDKEVRNITQSNSSFGSTTTAIVNDIVEFRLTVKNTSSKTAKDVIVTDTLPDGLVYISGSFHVGSGDNLGNLFGKGADLGDLKSKQSRIITFRARATRTGTLVNKSTADASNTAKVSDSASVTVLAPAVAGIFIAPPTGTASTLSFTFAGLAVLGYALYRRKEQIKTLIQ